jgi:hypothetical protein
MKSADWRYVQLVEQDRTTAESADEAWDRASGELRLRYEDVSQEGMVRLEALSTSVGVVWERLLRGLAISSTLRQQGILPILSEMHVDSLPGPFAVGPLAVTGGASFARTCDAEGQSDRVFLDLSAQISGPLGRTNMPAPAHAGQPRPAGRLFARHTCTRPFAPADQRRVRDMPELEAQGVTLHDVAASEPHKIATLLPSDAPLAPDLALDANVLQVGLRHTDSNQHVNSLVYIQAFEEACLRHLGGLGVSTGRLWATSVRVAYRKPSFAGESLRIRLRGFEHEGGFGAVGVFLGAHAAPDEKARAFLRMQLQHAS